jgi:hypothetical protein
VEEQRGGGVEEWRSGGVFVGTSIFKRVESVNESLIGRIVNGV